MHHPLLYSKIHKQHHQFYATVGIAAEYASPIETVFSSALPTFAGPILFGSHPYSLWFYFALRMWETIESHSGYDFPWSIWSLFDWQGMYMIIVDNSECLTGNIFRRCRSSRFPPCC